MQHFGIALLTLALCSPSSDSAADIAGVWVLNRDLTTVPAREDLPSAPRGGSQGGSGRFGGPGGPGRGGFRGMGGGAGAPMGRPSEEDARKMEIVRRRLTEVPDRLNIVRDGGSVSIVLGNGGRMRYQADGKKQEQLTGDGEFTTKTRFDGHRLVIEEDFGGRKITTTYTPVMDGETERLEVLVSADRPRGVQRSPGGRGSEVGPPEFKRVYDLESRGAASENRPTRNGIDTRSLHSPDRHRPTSWRRERKSWLAFSTPKSSNAIVRSGN